MSDTRYPVDWPEKKSSSNQCPDISGVYYDRASDAYNGNAGQPSSTNLGSGLVTNWDVVCTVPGDYYHKARDYMHNRCSLWHYFDPRASNYSPYYPERCPERTIEFSRINSLKMNIVFYENNKIFDKKSINLDGEGYRCEDGSIYTRESGDPDKFIYWGTEIFPAENGSIIIKKYSRSGAGIPVYPIMIPVGVSTSLSLYRWGRVDSGINPYKDCPEAQP